MARQCEECEPDASCCTGVVQKVVAACAFWRWRLYGRSHQTRELKRAGTTKMAQDGWALGSEETTDWTSAAAVETFEKNVDPSKLHVVPTRGEDKWITSSHCFQCALNTVHECADFGHDIKTFPNINRKWISAQVSERVHYPRVRYIVSYPPNTPPLPYHDHPGGEEYIVFSGAFHDTNFPNVDAPAFVRYPIGTHHAAMQRPISVRSDIMCWWGLMQATSSTEVGQHVPLSKELLVPTKRAPSRIDGPRQIYMLSKDGLETRIERWSAGATVVLKFERPIKEMFLLRGAVTLVGQQDGERQELIEGEWCGLPTDCTEASIAVSASGATVVVKELLPYDDWLGAELRSARRSWTAGQRAGGQGFLQRSMSTFGKLKKLQTI